MTVIVRALFAGALCLWPAAVEAQMVSQRGFVEGRGSFFPQEAPNDSTRAIGDLLVREEVFLKATEWLQLSAGLDFRANSHEQVQSDWRLDFRDRSIQRPKLAVRRLAATITSSGFTLDAGKQFFRWGRADILNPTDRFAPRDYLNVIDTEFLPVLGVRATQQFGEETLEGVWVPELTPSRLPLFDQRWTVLPPDLEGLPILDGGSVIPDGSQFGIRWNHTGAAFETSASYFDGFNHHADIQGLAIEEPIPAVALRRVYPEIRMIGGDVTVPTDVLTLKGEVAYFAAPADPEHEEYVLYVIEAERQVGEWSFVFGYAGDVVTRSGDARSFAPDRGIAKSILGRAAYTVDPNRTVAVEGALRQDADGFYVKGEYSQAVGQHLRLMLIGVGIGGEEDDFLGQFHRNSHATAALRYSF